MFAFADRRGAVDVAFTDREGGVSGGPYASLNLASGGGDDPAAVLENLQRVLGAFAGTPEAPLVLLRQVHGSEVARVGTDVDPRPAAAWLAAGPDAAPAADAAVAREPGVTLAVRVADCVPVVLADPDRGLVAAVHAGRRGVAAGVVPRAVEALAGLGAGSVVGWVGPHVCGGCYEVPAALRDEVARAVPETWAETAAGTPALDLGAGVAAQLAAAGVEVVRIDGCTREERRFHSFRRDGDRAGRNAALVRWRP